MKYLAVLILTLLPSKLFADSRIDMVSCDTFINGERTTLEYDINGHSTGPNP